MEGGEVVERERERERERGTTSKVSTLRCNHLTAVGTQGPAGGIGGPRDVSGGSGGDGKERGEGALGIGDGDGGVHDSAVWRSDVCICLSDDRDVHGRKHQQVQVREKGSECYATELQRC